MVRRKNESVFDVFARIDWHYGAAAALFSFIFFTVIAPMIHIPGWQSNPFVGIVDKAIHNAELLLWLAFASSAIFLAAALFSFIGQKQRRKLLDAQRGIAQLKTMDWASFELLVGEAFRRIGYRVEENGQGGADGGVDLILRKQGEVVLVQCKRWRQNVGAPVVREMFGLLRHHGASSVKIVSAGNFSRDAVLFAKGKPIELISGAQLIQMIGPLQRKSRQ